MLKKTLQNHFNNLHEKAGDAGMGSVLFHKGHGKSNGDNDVDDIEDLESKSFLLSVSKSSYSSSWSSSNLVLSYAKKITLLFKELFKFF